MVYDHSVAVTLPQLLDLALGYPEDGTVNFRILHTLLHVMIQQMELTAIKTEFIDSDVNRMEFLMEDCSTEPTLKLEEYIVPRREGGESVPIPAGRPGDAPPGSLGFPGKPDTVKVHREPDPRKETVVVVMPFKHESSHEPEALQVKIPVTRINDVYEKGSMMGKHLTKPPSSQPDAKSPMVRTSPLPETAVEADFETTTTYTTGPQSSSADAPVGSQRDKGLYRKPIGTRPGDAVPRPPTPATAKGLAPWKLPHDSQVPGEPGQTTQGVAPLFRPGESPSPGVATPSCAPTCTRPGEPVPKYPYDLPPGVPKYPGYPSGRPAEFAPPGVAPTFEPGEQQHGYLPNAIQFPPSVAMFQGHPLPSAPGLSPTGWGTDTTPSDRPQGPSKIYTGEENVTRPGEPFPPIPTGVIPPAALHFLSVPTGAPIPDTPPGALYIPGISPPRPCEYAEGESRPGETFPAYSLGLSEPQTAPPRPGEPVPAYITGAVPHGVYPGAPAYPAGAPSQMTGEPVPAYPAGPAPPGVQSHSPGAPTSRPGAPVLAGAIPPGVFPSATADAVPLDGSSGAYQPEAPSPKPGEATAAHRPDVSSHDAHPGHKAHTHGAPPSKPHKPVPSDSPGAEVPSEPGGTPGSPPGESTSSGEEVSSDLEAPPASAQADHAEEPSEASSSTKPPPGHPEKAPPSTAGRPGKPKTGAQAPGQPKPTDAAPAPAEGSVGSNEISDDDESSSDQGPSNRDLVVRIDVLENDVNVIQKFLKDKESVSSNECCNELRDALSKLEQRIWDMEHRLAVTEKKLTSQTSVRRPEDGAERNSLTGTGDTASPMYDKMSTEEIMISLRNDIEQLKKQCAQALQASEEFHAMKGNQPADSFCKCLTDMENVKKALDILAGGQYSEFESGNEVDFVDPNRFKELEGGVQELEEQINNLKAVLSQKIENVQEQSNDIEKQMGQLVEKVNVGLENSEGHAQDFSGLNELYNKIQLIQCDMEVISNTSARLMEEREERNAQMQSIAQQLEALRDIKADREELDEALGDKADQTVVNRKVSHDQFDSALDDLSKGLEGALAKLTEQEALWQQAMDEMQNEVETKLDKEEMGPLKEFVNDKLKALHERLKKLAQTRSQIEAAGVKKKLIRDVNCISCDVDAVIKHKEDSNVPIPPALPPVQSTKPHITYELDKIRKEKDRKKFPARNPVHLEEAVTEHKTKPRIPEGELLCNRYCGGSHTITTPYQRITRPGHYVNCEDGIPEATQQSHDESSDHIVTSGPSNEGTNKAENDTTLKTEKRPQAKSSNNKK